MSSVANFNLREIKRMQFVTKHYHSLRMGAALIPFNLFTLLWGLRDMDWLAVPSWLNVFFGPLGVAIISFATSYMLMPHPDNSGTGRVQPLPGRGRTLLLFILALVVAIVVGDRLDQQLQWPFSIMGLLIAGFMLTFLWQGSSFRAYYALLSLVVVGISLAPLFGFASNDVFAYGSGTRKAIFGTLLLIGGVCD